MIELCILCRGGRVDHAHNHIAGTDLVFDLRQNAGYAANCFVNRCRGGAARLQEGVFPPTFNAQSGFCSPIYGNEGLVILILFNEGAGRRGLAGIFEREKFEVIGSGWWPHKEQLTSEGKARLTGMIPRLRSSCLPQMAQRTRSAVPSKAGPWLLPIDFPGGNSCQSIASDKRFPGRSRRMHTSQHPSASRRFPRGHRSGHQCRRRFERW